jgi:hypothetical protein
LDNVIEITSGGMVYISSFMMIGSDLQLILRLLPQQFERVQCWYYQWERFTKYASEVVSGVMMYIPNFIKIGSGVQTSLRGIAHTQAQQGDLISLLLFFHVK